MSQNATRRWDREFGTSLVRPAVAIPRLDPGTCPGRAAVRQSIEAGATVVAALPQTDAAQM